MAFQLIDNYGDYSMINGTLKPTGNFAKTMGSFEF
jgi:hypothetical protein